MLSFVKIQIYLLTYLFGVMIIMINHTHLSVVNMSKKALSLYSTRTPNTWRRGLELGNAPPTPEFSIGDTNMLVSKM